MIAFQWLVRATIDTGMSITFQHDAADDVPIRRRQSLPVKGSNIFEALHDAGLNRTKQRQYRRFNFLPFSAGQSGHLRQPDIADGTAYPSL